MGLKMYGPVLFSLSPLPSYFLYKLHMWSHWKGCNRKSIILTWKRMQEDTARLGESLFVERGLELPEFPKVIKGSGASNLAKL